MKKIGFLFLVLSFAILANAQQNFEVITKKPVAGSVITIEYMPRNTVLQGVKDFEATAYLMEGKLPLAKAITLKQEGGVFTGTVKTNDTTKAVFFSFAKDQLQDNNNDEGYYTMLYDKAGNILAGSNLSVASGLTNYGGIWGLKRNAKKAMEFSEKEFADPTAKAKYHNEYFTFLSQSTEEASKELLKAELAKELEKKNLSESDMMRVKSLYENALKDKEKGTAIMTQVKERFPNGNWKRSEAISAFAKAKMLSDKEARFQDLMSGFTFTKDEQQMLDNYRGLLARTYADSGNYTAMKKYLGMMQGKDAKANTLNSIAWKLSGESLVKKPVDVKTGLELSAQSLSLIEEEKKLQTGKPSYLTNEQYQKNLIGSYYTFADTYATLLYHNGDFDKAYTLEKAAVEHFKRKDLSMNEAFALLTEKTKGSKAAQAELEKFFEEGKYTAAMKDQLKTIYLAANNNEEGWAKYVGNLEELAYNKMKAELAKKMINLPAPQFALKDMSGKEVALASLKGKIVVVDFWATWCGPCIASFPGMQKTVNKFKDKSDVVFLFIDTWENDSNRVQKVTDFIAKNKYSFNVLYDDAKAKEGNDFVVVEDFKVEGIPTKFVIDRNNNIRFKSVGYGGSAEAIVSELSAMIDMADAESGVPAKKAF
ncbi:MAG TPA: TlpA disulfide reductase family protein [Flavisolibacter sp.]|jgi:thiol-disulfide isomerase/thioredoxin|nr:TlpA disulfide reductase family protein [Flavisolibacter sp.]